MTDTAVMIITGTSRGIGNYLARYYLQQGYYVIGFSRQDVSFPSPTYRHFTISVDDEDNVKKAFKIIRSHFGRLDVLINNAGIASMNHSLLTTMATLDAIYATNVKGLFLITREAAKLMKKKNYGRIVNFTSIAVPLKLAGEAAYASSKAAVISLTQIFAKELAQFGITVNAIGPTPIETDLIKGVPAEKLSAIVAQQAIPRFGKFEDVSNVIDFFISSASGYITGQTIFLGGLS